MQHATPLHASHAIIQRRLSGATLADLAGELRVSQPVVYRALASAHLSRDDIDDLKAAGRLHDVRVRPCMCCGRLIASPHIGVRLCQPCRVDGPPIDPEGY